jgi:uncharacterized damage-inducible protein DinB
MNKEIQSIIRNLQRVNSGQPWFGRPVYEILDEIDPKKASIKPNGSGHTMVELIWHMLTWTEFVLRRIEGGKEADLSEVEKLDWREIDPKIHSWEKGVAAFKKANDKILQLLADKDDTLLSEIVDYREYNFRFLLNGLSQHHIYHLGQIAYIHKFLV